MKKKINIIGLGLIILNLQLLTPNSFSQNVGINSDGATPESGTMLDVKSAGTTSSTYGLKVKNSLGNSHFVVRSDGNVGVGTTSPDSKLHVYSNENTASKYLFRIENEDGTDTESYGLYLQAGADDANSNILLIQDRTGNNKMMMDGAGYLGIFNINAARPAYPVDIRYSGKPISTSNIRGILQASDIGNNKGIVLGYNAAETYTSTISSNGGGPISFWTKGITATSWFEAMRIVNISGNVGIGTTTPAQKLDVNGSIAVSGTTVHSSDLRYKKNVKSLENSLEKISQLKGVQYNWKTEDFPEKNFNDKTQIGVIAQEVEKIYPELVYEDKDGYKSVDYSHLTPILIEAIKEQQHLIDALKSENSGQKEEIKTLKANDQRMEARIKQLEEHLKTANK